MENQHRGEHRMKTALPFKVGFNFNLSFLRSRIKFIYLCCLFDNLDLPYFFLTLTKCRQCRDHISASHKARSSAPEPGGSANSSGTSFCYRTGQTAAYWKLRILPLCMFTSCFVLRMFSFSCFALL
jgi:hypothetical protein